MPQKANPISSEIIIGLGATASALTSALTRMQEAGHERSAGEWQIEWHVIPQLADLAGRAVAEATSMIEGLNVDPDRMRKNLQLDGGLVMAEAAMIGLAQSLGQIGAHDLVYDAARRVRGDGVTLVEALQVEAAHLGLALPAFATADHYLGEADQICRIALERWEALPPAPTGAAGLNELALE